MLDVLRRIGSLLQALPRGVVWLAAIGWMVLIWRLSGQPSIDEPRHPWMGFVVNFAHAPLFGLLALWFALLLPREKGWPRFSRAAVGLLLAGVLLYALADELHQSTVPGRHASGLDVTTDLVGAAAVVWVAAYSGSSGATERGVWKRLAIGLLACLVVAAAATAEG